MRGDVGNDQHRGRGGVKLTAAYFGGLVLLFIGERIASHLPVLRTTLALVASLLVFGALGLRIRRLRSATAMSRPVEKILCVFYALGIVSLLIYAGQSDLVLDALRPLFGDAKIGPHLWVRHHEVVSTVAWITVLVLSLIPIVFVEIAYFGMHIARTVDHSRISYSWQSGAGLGVALGLVFTVNFIASNYDKQIDLSYFKTTQASSASIKMVEDLSAPLDIYLFFARPNQVSDHVSTFLGGLARRSKRVKLHAVDHDLEPDLAQKLAVSRNGAVVIAQGDQHQMIAVGDTLLAAKSTLKRLDSEFQRVFLKVTRARKTVYLTVGHRERGQKQRGGVVGATGRGDGLLTFRRTLRHLNYRIKTLGIADGLAAAIPDDADVVMIIGPQDPFLPAEVEALRAYLDKGGRIALYLDAESQVTMSAFLGPYGLSFSATPLTVAYPLARLTRTKADRRIIVSNRFGAHRSVKTLSANSGKLAFVLRGAGYLEPAKKPDHGPKSALIYTLRSMPRTWADTNANFVFDRGQEKEDTYRLGAAVTVSTSVKKPAREGRMVVFADSDAVSDVLLASKALGNAYLLVDSLHWLGGEEKFIGERTSEEDIRIAHTRKEDEVWFYGTIFLMPALILGIGFWWSRRRRRV